MIEKDAGEHVVVVGAGVVGIACAHYLSKAGFRVAVVDQGTVAAACSHGNCGYICPSHVLPLTEPESLWLGAKSIFNPRAPFRIKPSLRPELGQWMWQFARRCNHRDMLSAAQGLKAILESSMEEYKRLMREEDFSCEWTENGLLYVFETAHGMDGFAKTDRLISSHFGVSATRIEGADLPAFDAALKPGLAGAFHYPGDVSVRPDLLNKAWAERLRNRGVTFVEHCSLTGLRKKDGIVTGLETSQGIYERIGLSLPPGPGVPSWSRIWDAVFPWSRERGIP